MLAGMAEERFKDGKLSGEGDYAPDGKRQGPWRRWHDTGAVLDEGVFVLGKKTGEWVSYDKAGNETQRKTHRLRTAS